MNRIARHLIPLALYVMLSPAWARLAPTDVPTFRLRARVVSMDGKSPGERRSFSFRLSGTKKAQTASGSDWSKDLVFDIESAVATTKLYPNLYLRRYPVVVRLSVHPGSSDITVEAQLRWTKPKAPAMDPDEAMPPGTDEGDDDMADELDEKPADVVLRGDLFGPSLGFLVYRDEKQKPVAQTMADYNHRYWKWLDGVEVPAELRPRHFPIVDRFIGGDHDRRTWREGIQYLARAGFSAIMMPASKRHRAVLLETGLRRTSWAVYNPPGYAFDYSPSVTDEAIRQWAKKQAEPYLSAGFERKDMALFTMSDEPGWYFPSMLKPVTDSPRILKRFQEYLRSQGLSPAEVGVPSWDEARPIGRSQAKDLPTRRLFHWSMRFYAWDSARHFARCTKALEEAFYPGLPILTNWNFFSGRFYFPGPFGNNPDKTSPDSAMGCHDWLEFGRLRGCTMLWTEDWFGDDRAWQWSFYCSKLNSAARKGGVQFGGYVIPRTCGGRKDGILQRILTVIGSGGKAVKYFVFGPEYNFPGNCYSFKSRLLPKMAEAHRMIGAAEDLLWPGRRPRAQVAILHPRSALLWDAKGIEIPTEIVDATNVCPERNTVDYLAEGYGLYLALQHANIPVDWVEEEDLSPAGLAGYRVLYLTEPNVPRSSVKGLIDWVRGGGTLVTVTGAATADRYDEPCGLLAEFTGIVEKPRARILVADARKLEAVDTGTGALGAFRTVGARGHIDRGDYRVKAAFDDESPAIVQQDRGTGRIVHFAWLPGASYVASSHDTRDKLPVGFSDAIRKWAAYPTELAGVTPPVTVSAPMVETPLLLSEKGAAVTLLNWTGEDQKQFSLSVRVPFEVKSVEAVKAGRLAFQKTDDGISVSLPLGAAEILMLRP